MPRYDRFSVLLHWLMAALLMAQVALGWWMQEIPKDTTGTRAWWFNAHKSIGMALGLLALVRVAWAARRARVEPVSMGAALQAIARASHRLLYALMLLLPLSGFLGSVFSGYPVRFFGLRLPQMAQRWDAGKEWLSAVHAAAAWGLVALIALHVLAALYHQYIRRDGLLQRMR